MNKILVFAGTAEGREISEYLAKNAITLTVATATEYGAVMLPKSSNIKILKGRLAKEEIANLTKDYDLIIDATHPFAKEVSLNIAEGCKKEKLMRIIRKENGYNNTEIFESIEQACNYLKSTKGNILVTTGSKELLPYTTISDYANRVFVRMLPTTDAIQKCEELGFSPKNLICMLGPFSEEINIAMLKHTKAKYIVTKETGNTGGVEEKISAANKLNVQVILIGRPIKNEEGITLEDAKKVLMERLNINGEQSGFFPFFENIKNKEIVIIGGGEIALRRAISLLSLGGKITVVAKEVCEELQKQKDVILILDKYNKKYIKNAFCVVGATNNREVNKQIGIDCKEANIRVNVADCKEESDFYFPSLFKNQDICGGLISIDGNNHKNAKKYGDYLREILNKGIDN